MHSPISPKSAETCQPPEDIDLSWVCESLTIDTVRDLAPEWEDLAQGASERNIFQFPQFIRLSLPLLAAQNPRIVTVRHSGLLIGVAILRADLGYAKLPVLFWKSALHPEQFLGTPLVRAGFEEEYIAGLTGWLDQAPFQCGFLQFAKVSSEGPFAEALLKHCDESGRGIIIANRHERAAVGPRLGQGSKGDSHLSASRRKSIRRAKKKLHNAGEVSIERLSKQADLGEWTDQFLAMEDTGWKNRAGSSILSSPDETALYKATIQEAFEAGNLNLTRLCLDGKPIAYTLDVLAPPIGFCLKSAIDPDYRKFSPGVLMEFETLQYYQQRSELELIDSCTHPDNAMLNQLWPDKRGIMDVAIARRGMVFGPMFAGTRALKATLKGFSDA